MEIKLSQPPTPPTTDTAGSSNYGTPVAPTPNVEISPATPSTPAGFFAPTAASATSTPVPHKQEVLQQAAGAVQQQPITSPLPNTPAAAAPPAAFHRSGADHTEGGILNRELYWNYYKNSQNWNYRRCHV